MTDSRMTVRPEMVSDLLGYLLWEYDILTMMRSTQFVYGHSVESEKVTTCAQCTSNFTVIYGESAGSNCTLCVDGKKTESKCVTKFLKPL